MSASRPFNMTQECWLVAVCVMLPLLSACSSARLVVPGSANIFGAGHVIPPAPAGGGAGTAPPSYSFSPASGTEVLAFPSITGQVVCDRDHFPANGPDGGPHAGGSTDLWSCAGISGLKNKHATMFLVGVFLDDKEPMDPAPSCLDFNQSTSFAELYPALRQTFFIGDGLTGTGSGELQRFHVPPGATRLFLGFADGWASHDRPGWYGDNAGSLTVELRLTQEHR